MPDIQKELVKLAFFLVSVFVFIYLSERHIKYEANQFLLSDLVQIHHNKDYSQAPGKPCPLYPESLLGNFDVNIYEIPSGEELKTTVKNLEPGGLFRPQNCVQREKLAIIIPYRDRPKDLAILLKYLHPFLQRQSRYYRIILVEQVAKTKQDLSFTILNLFISALSN